MDQIKDKFLNLILTIQQGRNMSFARSPLVINATLNHEWKMESEPVEASDGPNFNTNLLWEIEKKEFRKMRSLNQPLRIELLDAVGKIGHLHVDLRSAQLLSGASGVKCAWRKLIVNRKNNWHPELLVGLAMMGGGAGGGATAQQNSAGTALGDGTQLNNVHDDGYIQLGGDAPLDKYWLTCALRTAHNMDVLLPETLVFQATGQRYHMEVDILGNTVCSQEVDVEVGRELPIDEKVVLKMQCNLETLCASLTQMRVWFCGTDVKLGVALLELGQLVQLGRLERRIVFKSTAVHSDESEQTDEDGDSERSPSLDLEVCLTQVEEFRRTPVEVHNMHQMERYCMEMIVDRIEWVGVAVRSAKRPPLLRAIHPQNGDCLMMRNMSTAESEQYFSDLRIRLVYICKMGEIMHLMRKFPLRLVLVTEDGQELCSPLQFREVTVPRPTMTESTRPKSSRTPRSTTSSSSPSWCTATFFETDTLEEIARCTYSIELMDQDIHHEFVEPVTMNRIVELEQEWSQKSTDLEAETQKCRILQEQFQQKIAELKEMSESRLQHETQDEDDEQPEPRPIPNQYQLTDEAKEQEAKGDYVLNRDSQAERFKLHQQMEQLQRDNEDLRKQVTAYQEEIKLMQKCNDIKEQTGELLGQLQLLEAEFSNAQNVKKFYQQNLLMFTKGQVQIPTAQDEDATDEEQEEVKKIDEIRKPIRKERTMSGRRNFDFNKNAYDEFLSKQDAMEKEWQQFTEVGNI